MEPIHFPGLSGSPCQPIDADLSAAWRLEELVLQQGHTFTFSPVCLYLLRGVQVCTPSRIIDTY